MNYIKEVAEREEHVVKETQEAEDVDESDKSDFDHDEIPPVQLEDWDMNVIDFDEFGSGEDSVAANIVKKDRKCSSKTDIVILVMMISLEGSLHMLSMEGLQGQIGFWFNNGCMDDSRKALRLQRHEALGIWLDMSIISVVAAHSGYE
ncbi:hypothetical protein Tco_0445088 [Tanacetum coccineum]